MIFVRDKGQMCNNMLQYAHAYAWAREHNRSVLSMRFSYKYHYFRLCHERKHNFLCYLFGKYGAQFHLFPTVSYLNPEDEGSKELEQCMLSSNSFMLEGWYVRFYELFLKYKKEIVEMFVFNDEITARIRSYIKANSTDDLRLGIHVRRGDYKMFKGGKYFYDDETYIAYIRAFCAAHNDQRISVFICSNDPHLDKEKFCSSLPQCQVIFPNGNPAEDLCLLSECNYLIGAPSTFSLVASMYHDLPLLWMQTADCNSVNNETNWGKFDKLFREII